MLDDAPYDDEPLLYDERLLVEEAWQAYLRGQAFVLDEVQGRLGPGPAAATRSDPWSAVVTPSAQAGLARVDPSTRRRIVAATQRMLTARRCRLRKLSNPGPPTWRLSDGGWQVIFSREATSREIVLLRVRQLRPTAMTV